MARTPEEVFQHHGEALMAEDLDEIMLLEWKAESENVKVDGGIDTFVFRDGLIPVQTVRYTVSPRS